MEDKYVLGVDYGTDSVRALIINTANGDEITTDVHYYSRWKEEKYCDPLNNQFRQHPLDYLEGLEITIKNALSKAQKGTAEKIKGMTIDTTGSTPVAVNKEGTPLSLLPEFSENPNAMFILWKDHTGVKEADEINGLTKSWGGEDYTKYEGGVYSSEWFWSKILHTIRKDEKIRKSAFSWVEHCDWLPAHICGNTDPLKLKRGRCSAGHKAMWHASWDGLPSEGFLNKLDPLLNGVRSNLYQDTYTVDQQAGTLSQEWADKLGLSTDVVVGVGAFDAHIGAIGAKIKPYTLVKIMGTSTCDMLVAPNELIGDKLIKGICGQVDGSIIPGMLGMEAGQSAFGDIYAWFKNVIMWPMENLISDNKMLGDVSGKIIAELSDHASKTDIGESGIIALDWMNGRRTPFANQALKGNISGLNLGSDAPKIFRALVESTAFGSKKINDQFKEEGVEIREVIAIGGVAKKSSFIMQVVADVLNLNIKVAQSEQACAVGAAICAATAAGIYDSIEKAQENMGSDVETEYKPVPENAAKYQALYERYSKMGDFIETQFTEK